LIIYKCPQTCQHVWMTSFWSFDTCLVNILKNLSTCLNDIFLVLWYFFSKYSQKVLMASLAEQGAIDLICWAKRHLRYNSIKEKKMLLLHLTKLGGGASPHVLLHSGGLTKKFFKKRKTNFWLSVKNLKWSIIKKDPLDGWFIYPSSMVYDNCAWQQKRCRKPLVRLFSRGWKSRSGHSK
jgi:hypothetical protein